MPTTLDLTNPDTRLLNYARMGCRGGILVTCSVFDANPFVVGPDGLDPLQLAEQGGHTEAADMLRQFRASATH